MKKFLYLEFQIPLYWNNNQCTLRMAEEGKFNLLIATLGMSPKKKYIWCEENSQYFFYFILWYQIYAHVWSTESEVKFGMRTYTHCINHNL